MESRRMEEVSGRRQLSPAPSDSGEYVIMTEEALYSIRMESNNAYGISNEDHQRGTARRQVEVTANKPSNNAYSICDKDHQGENARRQVEVTANNPSNNAYSISDKDHQGENARRQVEDDPCEEFYEEIPPERTNIVINCQSPVNVVKTREAKPVSTEAISPGNALVSFWQGKVEVALRVTIILLGVPVFFLLLAALANASAISNSQTLTNFGEQTPTLVIGSCWMVFLLFTGTMEVFFLIVRVMIANSKAAKCILIWDIVHNIILYMFYLLCFCEMVWLAAVWSNALPSTSEEATQQAVLAEGALFSICTMLTFLMASLYMLKACWLIAFIKEKWGQKMEKLMQTTSTKDL